GRGTASAGAAPPGGAPAPPPDEISALLARLGDTARARDSLTALADKASGEARQFLEDLIWQRHGEITAGVLAVAERIQAARARGRDVTGALRILNGAIRDEWPDSLAHLPRPHHAFPAMPPPPHPPQ